MVDMGDRVDMLDMVFVNKVDNLLLDVGMN